VLGCEWV